MSLRRSKYEIVSEILKISNKSEGVNITKIVYSANLNFKNAQKIIQELVKDDLLEVLNGEEKKRFRTTKKGLKFIESYKNLSTLQHF